MKTRYAPVIAAPLFLLVATAIVSCTTPPSPEIASTPAPGPEAPAPAPADSIAATPAVPSALDLPCTVLEGDEQKAGGQFASRWPNGARLRIQFLDADAPKALCDKVMAYGQQWSRHANLTFVRAQAGEKPHISITFRGVGHWSKIGIESSSVRQGQPSMSLSISRFTPDDEIRKIVLHEFGHAVGLVHEHRLPSASAIVWNEKTVFDYYKNPPNKWSKSKTRTNIIERYNDSNFAGQYTTFDKTSIMCYPIPKGFANIEIPWNQNLSRTDKNFIAEWYPKS